MDSPRAVQALSALAHETRLAVFRLLVEAGPAGLPAGVIAERLGLPPSSLTFHVQHLHRAGLLTQRRLSRQVIYATDFAGMDALHRRLSRQVIYATDFAGMDALLGFLTENCCGGGQAAAPVCCPAPPVTDTARKAAS